MRELTKSEMDLLVELKDRAEYHSMIVCRVMSQQYVVTNTPRLLDAVFKSAKTATHYHDVYNWAIGWLIK